MPFIVAIDGPAGAGKSTVARRVAAELGFTYLDTGAMYRAVAWLASQGGVNLSDTDVLASLARQMRLEFSPLLPDGTQRVVVDGTDVTTEIRSPENSQRTSAISAIPAVRRIIVEQQQQMGKNGACGVVLEGRDIGTVVFPDADVKFFLTASPEERARRRYEELKGRGLEVDYAHVLAEQKERDDRDSQRADSPLRAAPDALTLDTDGLSAQEVIANILSVCRARMQK